VHPQGPIGARDDAAVPPPVTHRADAAASANAADAGPAPLLLLTGSPGCGKTTVAPLVADLHEPSVCLDLDWFFAKLRRGAIEPWRPEAHGQNRLVLHAAAEAVAVFAAGGYVTVAEGILYPFMLDLFAAAATRCRVDLHYAVLQAPRELVQRRVRDRRTEPQHAAALADAEVVDDLWTQFAQQGVAERHRVDSGRHSPDQVADEIDRRFGAGDFRLESS
jgi:predicted kinase